MKLNSISSKLAIGAFSLLLIGFLVKTLAFTTPPPAVEIENGPLLKTAQTTNIALALSVEWPTSGQAYPDVTYQDGKEYIGYFNPKRCYTYPGYVGGGTRTTANFVPSSDYFVATGFTDANRYCNQAGTGTGFSGNYLNYVSMSAMDILRLALTGGYRDVDTADLTILQRATLYSSGNTFSDGYYFGYKALAANLVTRVTPFTVNQEVFSASCLDQVFFGTGGYGNGNDCGNPGSTQNLNPATYVAATSGAITTTIMPTTGPNAPIGTAFVSAGTLTFTYPVTGPVNASPQFTATGSTTNTAPTSGPITLLSTTTTYAATGSTTTTMPTVGPVDFTWTAIGRSTLIQTDGSPGVSTNHPTGGYVCRTSSGSGRLVTFPSTGVSLSVISSCPSGTSYNLSTIALASDRNIYNTYRKNYTIYTGTTINTYRVYTTTSAWIKYNEVPVYQVYGAPQYAVLKPRVKVCDDDEAATRPDLCLSYPSGKFKPVGELQKKADAVRVSAFGYLLDNNTSRYGGVLRAPMKYLGPNKYDTTGAKVANTENEWDASTGVFISNPLADAGAYSGVVNYLNRFGITGDYKSYDPVGELYYEALRYLQGLQPTAQATSGATTAMADGFPYYTNWTDPVENSCQRNNYILAIGDVNVWYDRSLPGAGENDAGNFVRATETIPGTSRQLNSKYWTNLVSDFETGTSTNYVDTLGRNQNTLGNPNPRTGLSTLDTKLTGASQGGYTWAGLAYWANTQPIREDVKAGSSMKDVRVRTFTIDVDEGGNGSIEDDNDRGTTPRNSAFYLAGKYGFFKDSNLDGNPYKSTQNTSSNAEWTGGSAGDLPVGYVLASQAQRLVDAIKSFFSESAKESGTISVSSVSSTRFAVTSANGGKFSPRFDTRDWSGTVIKTTLSLNTVTGDLSENPVAVWDAGLVLTQGSTLPATTTPTGGQIRPEDRKIVTAIGATTLVAKTFTYADLGADIPASYSTTLVVGTVSTPISNTLMLSYLRGDRTFEIGKPNGVFRSRSNILGDIVNSGPIYKKEANATRFGTGYKAFSDSARTRTGAVYVGAGDGMLHAFRETDAKELFAYIPNALIDSLPVLASPTYRRRAFVDAVPEVDEVQINGAWKTILASGMGGGARGIFALDVTNPDSFSKDNVLFEFTNKNDADMGNVVTAPKLVKMRVAGSVPANYKWYLAVTSGFNNYRTNVSPYSTSGEQALFLLSVEKTLGEAWVLNDNYFKMSVPLNDATKANGMSQAGLLLGEADEVTTFYTGDLQGNVWKFAFPDGLSSAKAAIAVKVNGSNTKVPLFTAYAADGTTRQPITVAPVPQPVGVSGYMLTFGTGKFLEENDNSSTSAQTMYGVWDDGGSTVASYSKLRSDLYQRTASVGTATIDISTGTFTLGSATGNKRGWFFNLPETRERIAVDGTPGTGFVQFNSTVPGGGCNGDGYANSYILNFGDGSAAAVLKRDTNSGFRSKPIILDIEIDANYTSRDVLGRRTANTEQKSLSGGTKIGAEGTNVTASVKLQYGRNGLGGAGRLNWREIKDFNGAVGN